MTGATALVGASGFVGGNLRRARAFDLLVGSANADELRGRHFDHVVFSAARAEKWRANSDPEADRRHIEELVGLLGSFRTDRLTLISTVDVYAKPVDVDETSPIETDGLHQYGAGRRALEIAAAAAHPRTAVVRLPALHGPGLKKNVIFDLLDGNQVERIQPASAFQYYDLTRLADDLDVVWRVGLSLVNLVTEPVTTAEVVDEAFGLPPLAPPADASAVRYDVRTVHATRFGGRDGWIADRRAVLERLRAFVREERSGAEGGR